MFSIRFGELPAIADVFNQFWGVEFLVSIVSQLCAVLVTTLIYMSFASFSTGIFWNAAVLW